MLDQIRSDWDVNAIIQETKRADVLVLDDLGAGYVSEKSQGWYQSIFWRIIDHRTGGTYRTLITTNLQPQGIKNIVGDRSWSRLKLMMARGQPEKGMDGLVNLFDVPDYRSKDWKG